MNHYDYDYDYLWVTSHSHLQSDFWLEEPDSTGRDQTEPLGTVTTKLNGWTLVLNLISSTLTQMLHVWYVYLRLSQFISKYW